MSKGRMFVQNILSCYLLATQDSPLPLTDPHDAEAQRMLKFRIASYGNKTISSTRPSCRIQIAAHFHFLLDSVH